MDQDLYKNILKQLPLRKNIKEEDALSVWMIPVMIFLPLLIGAVAGIPAGMMLKKARNQVADLIILIGMILLTSCIGFFCNSHLMPSPMLNFMLMGMAFSAAFSNVVSEERLETIVSDFNPKKLILAELKQISICGSK